jgi:hypothetical protein
MGRGVRDKSTAGPGAVWYELISVEQPVQRWRGGGPGTASWSIRRRSLVVGNLIGETATLTVNSPQTLPTPLEQGRSGSLWWRYHRRWWFCR